MTTKRKEPGTISTLLAGLLLVVMFAVALGDFTPEPVFEKSQIAQGTVANPFGMLEGVDGIPFVSTWENTAGEPEFYAITLDGTVWACRNAPDKGCWFIWQDLKIKEAWERAVKD